MIPGIDVSHYQGSIDWQQVAQFGIQFAYIKVSDGVSVADLCFRSHWDSARSAALIVGPYHYMRPGSPELQCSLMFSRLLEVEREGSLPIAIDIEDAAITASEVSALLVRLRDYYAQNAAVLYMDRSMARQLGLANPPVGDMVLPLWLAEYDVNTTILPVPPWTGYTFWQYGFSRIPGVQVPTDRDWFKGTIEDLKAMCSQ